MHPILKEPLPQYLEWYTSAKAVQADLRFFNSPIGCRIRQLLSPVGLVPASLCQLFQESKECLACHCVFSIDGFNAHIDYDGTCKNWHNPITGEFFVAPIRYCLTSTISGLCSASGLRCTATQCCHCRWPWSLESTRSCVAWMEFTYWGSSGCLVHYLYRQCVLHSLLLCLVFLSTLRP